MPPLIAALLLSGLTEPESIRWGASLAELKVSLARECASLRVRPIDPPFLPGVRAQMQIDCTGLAFWGGRRRAEFVIGDDRLEMVWIMIEPGELARARAEMSAAYGPPTAAREDMVGFPDRRTGLRAQPPEILFYAPSQAAEWRTWYAAGR